MTLDRVLFTLQIALAIAIPLAWGARREHPGRAMLVAAAAIVTGATTLLLIEQIESIGTLAGAALIGVAGAALWSAVAFRRRGKDDPSPDRATTGTPRGVQLSTTLIVVLLGLIPLAFVIVAVFACFVGPGCWN